MRAHRVAAVLAVVLLTACATGVMVRLPTMRDATVLVTDGRGHGAGVHVGGGLIATADHVVDGAKSLSVEWHGGETSEAVVMLQAPDLDFAILAVPEMHGPAAVVSCDAPLMGEPVSVVGHPLASRWTITQGHVASVRTLVMKGEAPPFVVLDVSVNPGDSGGPVYDAEGRVIGIASAFLATKIAAGYITIPSQSGLGLMIPSSVWCGLLDAGRDAA